MTHSGEGVVYNDAKSGLHYNKVIKSAEACKEMVSDGTVEGESTVIGGRK